MVSRCRNRNPGIGDPSEESPRTDESLSLSFSFSYEESRSQYFFSSKCPCFRRNLYSKDISFVSTRKGTFQFRIEPTFQLRDTSERYRSPFRAIETFHYWLPWPARVTDQRNYPHKWFPTIPLEFYYALTPQRWWSVVNSH